VLLLPRPRQEGLLIDHITLIQHLGGSTAGGGGGRGRGEEEQQKGSVGNRQSVRVTAKWCIPASSSAAAAARSASPRCHLLPPHGAAAGGAVRPHSVQKPV
jgi:hypothetical protein